MCDTRIEEFAKEEMDLTLATCLEFNTPLADLSDVKTMMDSINVVPGLSHQHGPVMCDLKTVHCGEIIGKCVIFIEVSSRERP